MAYIITNKTEPELAWSNTYGWCSETFDTFTDHERCVLPLPVDGEWSLVSWNVDADPEDAGHANI